VRVDQNSSRVHYLGTSRDLNAEIFSVPIDGSAYPLQLTSTVLGVIEFTEAPDGSRLAYDALFYEGPPTLGTVPPDDPSGSAVVGLGSSWSFTPDGRRLLFLEGPAYFDEPVRLVMRAADGSSPAIELAPRSPAGDVTSFQMTPDGTKAVFCCDPEVPGKRELFSVPTDGSLPPTKLSGLLADDRGVSDGFTLTSDGLRVLYAADRDASGVFELFVAPVDGSSAPLELSGTMVAGGDVARVFQTSGPLVQVTPDSSRVVYVADQDVDERFELYSVPIDRSSPPIKLNPPLVAGGDIGLDPAGIRLNRDGTRVVYLADQTLDERFELYSAPVDGNGRSRALSGDVVAGGDVSPGFLVLQRSDAVVFLSDRAVNGISELWLASLDGRAPPRRCSEIVVPAGDVQPDFLVASDESFVYYRADALEAGRVEFFRFPLENTPPHARR